MPSYQATMRAYARRNILIRWLHADGWSQSAIARKYKISRERVGQIVRKRASSRLKSGWPVYKIGGKRVRKTGNLRTFDRKSSRKS